MKDEQNKDQNKDILSNDEIEALINNVNSQKGNGEEALNQNGLTAEETDFLGEVGNIAMGSAATALYSLLEQKVEITAPDVKVSTLADVVKEYERPCVLVQVEYLTGLEGINLLIIKEEDAAIIADLMMGGDGSNVTLELDEIHLSAVCEAMNQMMGSSATSMSSILNEVVNISPPQVQYINIDEVIEVVEQNFASDEEIIDNSFRLKIGDLIDSSFKQLSKLDFAKQLIFQLMSQESALAAKDLNIVNNTEAKLTGGDKQMANGKVVKDEEVGVQRAQFPNFSTGVSQPLPHNMELIQDVPLQVTVRLGKTRMKIREILKLGEGSIVELDKLAGEPVDLLINGKLVAKGEVVVIDENFGFRVKDIISPMDRINNI